MRISIFSLPLLFSALLIEGYAVLIIIAAAVVHEAGHLTAMRVFRSPLRRMDIQPMGACIYGDESELSVNASLIITLSGALFNFIAVCACLPVFLFWKNAYLLFFVLCNTFLGVYNLLPHRKQDGGKAVFLFLLTRYNIEKAEKTALIISNCVVPVVIVCGFALYVASNGSLGVLVSVCSAVISLLL